MKKKSTRIDILQALYKDISAFFVLFKLQIYTELFAEKWDLCATSDKKSIRSSLDTLVYSLSSWDSTSAYRESSEFKTSWSVTDLCREKGKQGSVDLSVTIFSVFLLTEFKMSVALIVSYRFIQSSKINRKI